MAAIFSIRRNDPEDDKISISDTGTCVLLTVLILAGSALAETDSQRRLIVWLSERSTNSSGGNAGFCIAEMPWEPASFEADKQFLVRTADAASQKTGWQSLNYWPNAKALMPMLGWFRKGFVRLRAADIEPDVLTRWLADMEPDDPVLNGYPRCKKHRTYLTWNGCAVCSNAR